ncbi:Gfo/Idh/MocA family oxidoreductase [candidate division KSB1 bacterium]|nr:Gfo/Idh/MocA family oxidoreductase [candidate division KSB1 bacterium]
MRLAFIGFRHDHILALYQAIREQNDIEIVALCEPDAGQRRALTERLGMRFSHDTPKSLLQDVECDAVAIGDVYARRGALAIQALEAGRHVLSDKPICTEWSEWRRIDALCRERNLRFSCQFDLRDCAPFIGARRLIRDENLLGRILGVQFGGQHPLMRQSRPDWYFQPGLHGGTINDIAIHAFDVIPWITGSPVSRIQAARTWNARTPDVPFFRDGAQLLFSLDNQAGVIGDVSYFSPDSQGYALPHYWRMTFWGEKGMLETSCCADSLILALEGEAKPRAVPLPPGRRLGYLEDFRHDIAGTAKEETLTTIDVLTAARFALLAQKEADRSESAAHSSLA